ncbi:GDSL-type esterase/lipase family protein [Paenibacillus harenae]|uniref:Lysophospholipase L1-like esterase n=1 Tax=Paenibacillus harenae TaxID=306543 RepID=A0ABT9UBT1_PAEHA|nr:GDSL-type esterase/lipase family protein [Paenibacillus harenae]MDQ0115674.1 lysophospholipase L1-like esterase [Paenibacillus harenae]
MLPPKQRTPIIRPGTFSFVAAADRLRSVYDGYNEQLLSHPIAVDFDFIGESITQYWDLQVYFRSAGKFIINRGIAGDVTPTMLRRFPADVIQLKPKYVHILGGTNNTWRLDAVEGDQRRTPGQIYDDILKDFTMMVRLARSNGIMPIVGSSLPSGRNIPCFHFEPIIQCPNCSSDTRNELLAASNIALKKMTDYEGAIYIDYHAQLVGPDGKTLRPELADDSLHPNVLGYNIMAAVLRRSLLKYGIVI